MITPSLYTLHYQTDVGRFRGMTHCRFRIYHRKLYRRIRSYLYYFDIDILKVAGSLLSILLFAVKYAKLMASVNDLNP